jgi:hypothetical protein
MGKVIDGGFKNKNLKGPLTINLPFLIYEKRFQEKIFYIRFKSGVTLVSFYVMHVGL